MLKTLAAFTWPGAVTTILLPACALAIHALLIIGRVAMRRQAMFHLFPDHQARLRHIRWHFAVFLPVADIVSFFVVVRAAIARGFVWRGIRYRIAKDEANNQFGQRLAQANRFTAEDICRRIIEFSHNGPFDKEKMK